MKDERVPYKERVVFKHGSRDGEHHAAAPCVHAFVVRHATEPLFETYVRSQACDPSGYTYFMLETVR